MLPQTEGVGGGRWGEELTSCVSQGQPSVPAGSMGARRSWEAELHRGAGEGGRQKQTETQRYD
jgi:hypothetical protein